MVPGLRKVALCCISRRYKKIRETRSLLLAGDNEPERGTPAGFADHVDRGMM